MNPETLKEYLVKIGWNVDEASFEKAKSKIGVTASKVTSKLGSVAKDFIGVTQVVLEVLTTVNKTMLEVVETTADLDLETEKLARRYWISEEAARSYSTALDALGETQEDVFNMTDEQYRHLIELNNLGKTLEAPEALDDFLYLVRDINFEFSKTKVLFQYGTRWVTYWFSQFLGDDAVAVRDYIRKGNEYLQKNLPVITQKVAKFFEIFYRLGKAAFTIGKTLYEVVLDIFDLFDNKLGRTTTLVGAFFLLIKSGPIGWFIAAITTLLLLIDDYQTWARGGDSYLDWSGFDEQFKNIKQYFSDIKEDLQVIFDACDKIFGLIDLKLGTINLLKMAISGIETFTSLIADDFDRIGAVIEAIQSGSLWEKFKEWDAKSWISDRLQGLDDLWNNPLVGGIIDHTGTGDFISFLNNLWKWNAGANSNVDTQSNTTVGSTTNSTKTTNITNNYGGFSFNNQNEFQQTIDYLQRRDLAIPTK